jgi:hypothetical protein
MACPNLGKNARIALDANYIARMTSFSLTINNGNQEVTEFGINWNKFCQTIQNWNATVEGYYDRAGDVYQDQLQSIAVSAGEVENIRFYEDITATPSYYWACDTATDANASAFIETYSWNADPNGIVMFTMAIKGNGPIWRTS